MEENLRNREEKRLFSCVLQTECLWDIQKGWKISMFFLVASVKQDPVGQGLYRILGHGHTQRILWSASI